MHSPIVYKNKKVLVTGGAGFIGIHLSNALANRGAYVTIIDKRDAPSASLRKGIHIVKADIANKRQLGRIDNRFAYIFHLAAKTDTKSKKVEEYYENYEGTETILKWMDKKVLKRFVFYSSQLTVGIFNETRFIDEHEPYRTNTAYGESKVIAEKIVKKYCKKNEISYVIIRPTSVYGPFEKGPYRELFLAIKKNRYFHVGGAHNLVSLCYVENLIELTLLLGQSPEAHNRIYYGNDLHPYTMREIANYVASYYNVKLISVPNVLAWIIAYCFGFITIFGIPMPFYPFRLKNLQANSCYDMQNSIYVGYMPKFRLKDGLKETLDWFKKNDSAFL